MTDHKPTPTSEGYRMPAEWELHDAVWLAWPYDVGTFSQGIENTERTFCKIIKHLEGSEKIKLIVLDDKMQKRAENLLKSSGVDLAGVAFHQVEFTDVWIRDYGPFFLLNGTKDSLAWVKWQYNAYGKAQDPYFTDLLKDNEVFNKLTPEGKRFDAGIVLEGGAIEVNGLGTLLTTEQALLNPNRNPHLTQIEIEKYLKDYLGVGNIIWLKKGLINDHTDGHIDDIARFVASDKILVAYEDNHEDENFEILEANYRKLLLANDQNGNSFNVIKLPMPHMHFNDGSKSPVSYTNFYIANKVVLAPTFKDKNDESALSIIQSCFSDRQVVGVDCREIIYGGGSIHCMSQPQPKLLT